MLQRFAIALAQVISGNTSENLQNKITQTIYSLHHNEFNKVIKQNGYYIYE